MNTQQIEKLGELLKGFVEFGEKFHAVLSEIESKPVVTEFKNEWPQVGDVFFVVLSDGVIYKDEWEESDKAQQSIGNVFKTRAETERRVEALKVQAELRRMPGKCNFSNSAFGVIRSKKCFYSSQGWDTATHSMAGVWFQTKDQADNAINTIGQERLQLWLDDYLQTPIGGE